MSKVVERYRQYGSEEGKEVRANGVQWAFRTDTKPAFHPSSTALTL